MAEAVQQSLDGPSGQARFVEFFANHLLAICIAYSVRPSAERGFLALCGTLMNIRGNVVMVTAGHNISKLRQIQRDQRYQIHDSYLADFFGDLRTSTTPIPFALIEADWLEVVDEEAGLDFGIVDLSPWYLQQLLQNRVVAIDERHWADQNKVDFHHFMVLGLPEEYTTSRLPLSGDAMVVTTALMVERLDDFTEGKTKFPRFVGRVLTERLRSVAGMSGGPIFGFAKGSDGRERYWLVALQSSWLPEQRIIFGCPIPILAGLLAEAIDAAPSLDTVDGGSAVA